MKAYEVDQNWLKPLVQAWREKKEAAEKGRRNWMEVARECRRFYAGPVGWMWEGEHKRKMWPDAPTPTFRMSVNKAFEFVALYLPFLWSNLPHRTVTPKRMLDFDPALLFGPPPQMPPELQQAMQQAQQQQQPPPPQVQQAVQQFQMQAQQYQQQVAQYQQQTQMEKTTDDARAELMSRWLNYTPTEQPGGGLEHHGELMILDALITGRGVLWPGPYRMPGSERTLTRCVHRSVTDFYTDPDYDSWDQGTYVMRETTEPWWKVERRFRLPEGSLRNRGSMESGTSMAERAAQDAGRRESGQTKDQVTYTEVWSKGGPGCRMTNMDPKYRDHLQKVVGDYAYIAFSNEVPWPLNAPVDAFHAGATDEDVKAMFRWPVPYWQDGSWPCEVLDFYHDISLKEKSMDEDRTKFKGWPVAPMGPGLGELKFVNAAMSFLTGRIVSSCRDFWAVMGPAYDELVDALESGKDQAVVKINKIHGKLSDVLSVIQQPETRQDVWKIIDAVLMMLDKRWHLNALMYGMSGSTQERSATEVVEKRQAGQVVPEFMAKRVEKVHSGAAVKEAFCTVLFVKAKDVLPLMGQAGAYLWQTLIESADPEVVLRQMQYLIAAGSIRRPNRDKQAADLNAWMQAYGPLFNDYFKATGDPEAINETIEQWGDINERDVSRLKLKPPPPPQPDPAQQAQMQMEMQKIQAELQMKQLDLQMKQLEMQGKQADIQGKQQQAAAKLQTDQQAAQIKLGADQQKMQLDVTKAGMDLKQDQASFVQDLLQDRKVHTQELQQGRQRHEQELDILEEKSKAQVAAMKAQAKARPKPATSGNGKGK